MAWPPSAVVEGGARRKALGGMELELVPTEPSQTYPIASVCRLSIIEKRPTNLLVGLIYKGKVQYSILPSLILKWLFKCYVFAAYYTFVN